MLSPSWKNPARRWACFVLALALGVLVALLICPSAQAQVPQPAGASPPPAAAATPTASAASAPGPAAVEPTVPAAGAPVPAAATTPVPAAEATPTPAAAATPAPPAAAVPAPAAEAAPAKPPAPRLNRDYAGLPQPSADKEKEYLRNRLKIQEILKTDNLQPAQIQMLEDYYNNYALARWTFPDRQNQVAGYMNELRNDLARCYNPNRSSPGHDKLVEMVFRFMENCTKPDVLANLNLAPTTRFNAIMMIGELNQEEPSGSKAAKPLAKSLPILIARATDPQQIDAVRLGALIGVRRHCRLMDKNAQVPTEVAKLLVSLIRAKESERARSDEGHAWLRLLAIQTFADLQGRPNSVAVAKEILNVLAETDSPEFLRYAAAEALGNLDYRNSAGLDMKVMLQSLGLLAIEICDQERERLREELESKKTPASSMYGGMGGEYAGSGMSGLSGMSSMMETPMSEGSSSGPSSPYGYGAMGASTTMTKADRQIERARRRLKEGMNAALVGMGKKRKTLARGEEATGISAMAGTDTVKTQNVQAFSDPIQSFFAVIDTKDDKDKQIQPKALDTAIADVRKQLEAAIAQVGGTAPESPEFKPIPDTQPLGGSYGSQGMPY